PKGAGCVGGVKCRLWILHCDCPSFKPSFSCFDIVAPGFILERDLSMRETRKTLRLQTSKYTGEWLPLCYWTVILWAPRCAVMFFYHNWFSIYAYIFLFSVCTTFVVVLFFRWG